MNDVIGQIGDDKKAQNKDFKTIFFILLIFFIIFWMLKSIYDVFNSAPNSTQRVIYISLRKKDNDSSTMAKDSDSSTMKEEDDSSAMKEEDSSAMKEEDDSSAMKEEDSSAMKEEDSSTMKEDGDSTDYIDFFYKLCKKNWFVILHDLTILFLCFNTLYLCSCANILSVDIYVDLLIFLFWACVYYFCFAYLCSFFLSCYGDVLWNIIVYIFIMWMWYSELSKLFYSFIRNAFDIVNNS